MHGVAEYACTVFERRRHARIVVDLRHVDKVRVHVRGEYLAVRTAIIVAGVVPPPCHVAAELVLHRVEVVIVRHCPYAITGSVEHDLFRNFREGFEVSLTVGLVGPSEVIDVRYIMKRLDRVGRSSAWCVPCGVYLVLQVGEELRVEREVVGVVVAAGVIGEHAELADTQVVHELELVHYVGDVLVGLRIKSRVDGPDEADFRGMCRGGQFLEHVLGEPAVLLLLFGDGRRVGIEIIAGVIRVAFGSIEVGVELVAGHELHDVFLYGNRVGVAVISLDESARLLVGVVIDGDAGQVFCALVEHLFEAGEAVKRGICVLAKND